MTVDCRLAGLAVRFCGVQRAFAFHMHRFSAAFDTPDITVTVTPQDIIAERAMDSEYGGLLAEAYYEDTAAFRKLGEQLPQFSAVVFHCAMIDVAGRGIAFAARSGTGKTTHMNLWQQHLGPRMTIVNGDKPIVRFLPQGLTGYGTPWRGKENLGGSGQTKLTDICRIVRSDTNETVPLSEAEAVDLLLGQIYMPQDAVRRGETLAMIERMAKTVHAWEIRCNMDPDAAVVAYRAIFGTDALPDAVPPKEIQVYKTGRLCAGSFTPAAAVDSVFLPLPFLPFKITFSCADVLLNESRSARGEIITLTADATRQRLTVCGMANTAAGGVPFVLNRRNAAAFSFTEQGFAAEHMTVNGQRLVFAAGCTYEWTAVGE